MRKAFLLCSVAAFAVAVMAFPAGAAAQTNTDVSDCVLTGVAGTATPDDPNNTGVQAIVKDAQNGGIPDIDTGAYDFAGSAVCAFVDDNGPAPHSAAELASTTGVYNATITSAGRYANQICGTGTATSTPGATSVGFPGSNAAGEGPYTDDYTIQFTGGRGVLDINSFTNGDGETGSGAGEINIEPADGDCVVNDVKAFSVEGDFAVTIPQS